MKNILIVSATLKNNYTLGEQLKDMLDDLNVNSKLISLENFTLPLYTDDVFDDEKENYKKTIESLTDLFVSSDGIIICGPEYNGSSHPIINNAIAWISCSTDYWQDGFKNKIVLVTTSSGGAGSKFVSIMKTQMDHLGCKVMPDSISVNKSHPLDVESAKKTLKQFAGLL